MCDTTSATGTCAYESRRAAAARIAAFALVLTCMALVAFWMAARDGASMTVQGWLLLVSGLFWGTTVGFAAKAVRDEVQTALTRREARLRQEREWRKGLTSDVRAAIH